MRKFVHNENREENVQWLIDFVRPVCELKLAHAGEGFKRIDEVCSGRTSDAECQTLEIGCGFEEGYERVGGAWGSVDVHEIATAVESEHILRATLQLTQTSPVPRRYLQQEPPDIVQRAQPDRLSNVVSVAKTEMQHFHDIHGTRHRCIVRGLHD